MTESSKRIFHVALGCPKNQVDGEVMLGQALAGGHTIVDSPEQADVLVVNTCAFIEEARTESIDSILELAEWKGQADDPNRKKLVVTGCMAERYATELVDEIPEIDAMVGTGALGEFTKAIGASGGQVFTGQSHYLPAATAPREIGDHGGTAYIKVSDGCDHECSFCVIPSFRGRHASRSIEDIGQEAERLAEAGVVELNLVAQDLSAFGKDRGEKDGLAALLYRLGRVRGIERVRCLYLYPSTLSDTALAAIADVDNVVNYVDLPLQHADPGMLRAMRRHKDTGQILAILDRIRNRIPEVAIRTSFIVGFPGETPEAFDNLCRFVEAASFDRIGVFTYSPEEGSPAFDLEGRVDAKEAKHRRDVLMALQEPIGGARLAARVGSQERILVAGCDPEAGWFGRADFQAPDVDGLTFLGGDLEAARGRCVLAEITGADDYDLFGVLAGAGS